MLCELGETITVERLAEKVAHEINNPLACVQANLGSLARYASKIATYAAQLTAGEPMFARREDDEARRFFEQMRKCREELKLDFILGDLDDLISQSLHELKRAQQVVKRLGSLARDGHEVAA